MAIAVGGLAAVVVALVALIILYGLALLLRSVLQGLANHVPVIGGALSAGIGAIIDDAVRLGREAATAVLAAVIPVILAPVYWIERHIVGLIDFLRSIPDAIAYIIGSLIPSVIKSLSAQILAYYHAAVSYVQAEAQALEAQINADVTALYHDISAVQAALESYAQQLAAAAESYASALVAAETQFVQQVESALGSAIAAGLAAETQFVQAIEADTITYVQSLVTTAEQTLITDIGNVVTWVDQEVTALDASIAAMGTQVVALTLDAVGTVESELEQIKTGCLDNLCGGLSDLASLLSALTGDLGIAALLALAAEFAADPHSAAADVRSTLGPVAQDAAGAVRTLIGL